MPTAGTSPSPEQSAAQDVVCHEDKSYSFMADCRTRADRITQRLALTDLRCAEYLFERQVVLEAVCPGIVIVGGTHGPSNPTLDKQQKLDALRREYAEDLLRYRIVTRVLRWLNNPLKESERMWGRSEVEDKAETVPPECEGHYKLFLALVEGAVRDVLQAEPGSYRFESAVTWLTEGFGYTTMCDITRGAGKMKQHWLEIAQDRRDSLTAVI